MNKLKTSCLKCVRCAVVRIQRFSLAQIFLLVALVGLLVTVATTVNRRFSVTGSVPPLAVSPDGRWLAAGVSVRPVFSGRHPVLLKRLDDQVDSTVTLESHSWLVEGIAFAADGTKLYSVGDRSLRIWDTTSGEQVDLIDTGADVREGLAVSPKGNGIVATSSKTDVKIWDVDQGELVLALTGHTKEVCDVAFSPDGSFLVSGGYDSKLLVWETETWQLVATIKATEHPRRIVFLADGRLVAPGYVARTSDRPFQVNVTIYDIPSGNVAELLSVDSYAAISCVTASADGKYLAAAHGGDPRRGHSAITIWDAKSGRELETWTVDRHDDCWIDSMAFSSDAEILYCGSHNNVVSAQHWRKGGAEVVFASGKVFPWRLILLGGSLWLAAWHFAPRSRSRTSFVATPIDRQGVGIALK